MPLRVETRVPYGNACDVEVHEEPDLAEVRFTADPHGGPEALWFCFRVVEEQPGASRARQIRLVLKHIGNLLGGGDGSRLRPVVRFSGADWQRLEFGTPEVLPDGRRQAAWIVGAPNPILDVAFCYPYGPPEVEALVRDTKGYWSADTIGVSQAGRPLLRLCNDPGLLGSHRPGLYLIARQHSGETPGSWVLDGFLRQMAEEGEAAPLVWAVPLTNIDGVLQGDYGKDNFPWDLNRAWGSPPMRHEVLVLQRDMQRWKTRCRPVLAVDFHAPGASETDGIYAYVPDPQQQKEAHAAALSWTIPIQKALTCEYAAEKFTRVAAYASRWEQSPRARFGGYCREVLGVCSLTFEIPYAMAGSTLLTCEHYREAGRRMARAVLQQSRQT